MAKKSERNGRVPEGYSPGASKTGRKAKPEWGPSFFRRHPVLTALGTAAALKAAACAPSARAASPERPRVEAVQDPHMAVLSGGASTAPTTGPAQQPLRVAQATTPTETRGYTEIAVGSMGALPVSRLFEGGGAVLVSQEASPMTQEEFQEQIAYMFNLTNQFEVQPDSLGRYVTDEFIIKRSTGLADRAPILSIAIYGKNSLDGGDAREPLIPLPSRQDENFRVFRFRVGDNAIIHNEVVAILVQGGVQLFYFNKLQNRYTIAGVGYGPNHFGPNPKTGLEINTQSGAPYIGIAVVDPQKFDARGKPLLGSEVAAITLDLVGDGSKAILGAGLYKIQ